jgi:predicted nucleic acid-binding protein
MLRFMLDTNLCIRVLRDRPAGLLGRFNRDAEALCISTIVLTESLYGAEKSARRVENRREVDRLAARLAGQYPRAISNRFGNGWPSCQARRFSRNRSRLIAL